MNVCFICRWEQSCITKGAHENGKRTLGTNKKLKKIKIKEGGNE